MQIFWSYLAWPIKISFCSHVVQVSQSETLKEEPQHAINMKIVSGITSAAPSFRNEIL